MSRCRFNFIHVVAHLSDMSVDFDAQWLKLRGITQRCACWDRRTADHICGVKFRKNPLNEGVIRQIQPSQRKRKTSISSKLRHLFECDYNTLATLPNINVKTTLYTHVNGDRQSQFAHQKQQ